MNNDLQWYKSIKAKGGAALIVLALLAASVQAVQKAAVYLSLPERLDRLEITVGAINTTVNKILKEVE